MSLAYTLKYAAALREAVELRGYVLALTNTSRPNAGQRAYTKTGRVYRSERDKGKPDRALLTVTAWNRWTVPDALGQILEMEYEWRAGA